MDIIPDNIIVHNKDCNGCRFNNRDVMILLNNFHSSGRLSNYYDVFLTTEQAKKLAYQLMNALFYNKTEKIKI